MVSKWKLVLFGLSSTLFICFTCCTITGLAALLGGTFLWPQGATAP